jgi:hypothetical protein
MYAYKWMHAKYKSCDLVEIYRYVHTFICIHIQTSIHGYLYINIYIYTHIYIDTYKNVFIHVYIHIYVCMYILEVYIYINI